RLGNHEPSQCPVGDLRQSFRHALGELVCRVGCAAPLAKIQPYFELMRHCSAGRGLGPLCNKPRHLLEAVSQTSAWVRYIVSSKRGQAGGGSLPLCDTAQTTTWGRLSADVGVHCPGPCQRRVRSSTTASPVRRLKNLLKNLALVLASCLVAGLIGEG